ncbi:hypothetical protein ACIQPR_05165 [Streptomyces sp. NPDC091280]|uniref:hypothetical protein n=1 Tax=Streptomyces sp. NPDC091280 TaxID=3365984 RepID=UPI003807B758
MPNDQQPDDEQSATEYQRADQTKFPTSPAGQQASVEGMAAAEGMEEVRSWTPGDLRRAMKKPGPLEPTPALRRYTAQFLALTAQFEQDRRAEIAAAGGDPDEDRNPFEYVHAIADEWADSEKDPDRRAALLDDLADRLDTSEVRALRLAAEAAAAITPRLIYADADQGVSPAITADDLGMTESYVYRILRKRPTGDQ